MDWISEIEQETKPLDAPPTLVIAEEEPQTLTSAETELLIAKKRDMLYKMSVITAILFLIVALALVIAFKFNEDFFDANSRFGLLLESVNAQEENETYPKINIKAEFDDRQDAKLVLPLDMLSSDENIVVREEFTKNKLIIKLEGASAYISDGIKLTSDSRIMDAVGVYRQNLDVFVEVYCRDSYSYEISNSGRSLTVNFLPLRTDYDAVAIVYLPYEDRNRLALPEWQQSISQFASDNRIRLFMASNMQEPYTQQEVIEFAEKIKADVVLGIDVSTDANVQQTTATAICNTAYFMPDFNSAQLSVVFAEAFLTETQLQISGFAEADENTPLVYRATCPASMIKISQSPKDAESVETAYKLNEKLAATIIRTLGDIYAQQQKG